MKKITLLAFVIVSSLTSCKKVWNCECTNSSGSKTTFESTRMSRKEAKTWCENGNYSGTTCELK